MTINNDSDFMKGIAELDAALEPEAVKLAAAKDVCATYCRIKPTLLALLPWIEKIPVYGKTIANAVRAVMAVADTVCVCGG